MISLLLLGFFVAFSQVTGAGNGGTAGSGTQVTCTQPAFSQIPQHRQVLTCDHTGFPSCYSTGYNAPAAFSVNAASPVAVE